MIYDFPMLNIFILGIAGAAGTICRYLMGIWVTDHMKSPFFLGTVTVNVLGCLAIGLFGTLADEKSLLNPNLRNFIIIGFLGAFTTYSGFAYETWNLFKAGDFLHAGLNAALTFLLCFVGLGLGIVLARAI